MEHTIAKCRFFSSDYWPLILGANGAYCNKDNVDTHCTR